MIEQNNEEKLIFNIPPTTSDYYKQILSAKYLDGYRLELQYPLNKYRIVDLENELMSRNDEINIKYRNIELFKQVLGWGDLRWNNDFFLPANYVYDISTPIEKNE